MQIVENKFISVVIPLYNKGKYIQKTLLSVLNQTFQNFEVVVVDDGSSDNSLDIVKKIDDKRISIISQLNQGVSVARNTGIKNAKYNYIALLDADDEWKADYLETMVNLIENFPECSVFASAYEFKDSQDNIIPVILNKIPFAEESGILYNYFNVASCSHPPICSSAIVFYKEAFLSTGGFPAGIKSGEDLIVWAKLAFNYQIAYSKKPSAIFVLDDSHLIANNPSRLHDDTDYIEQELISLYKKADSDKKGGIKRYISMWYKMRASVFLRLNNKKKTYKYSILSLKYNVFNLKSYLFMGMVLLPTSWQTFIKNNT